MKLWQCFKEGLDFNSDEPGIPTRDFESILFTKSAEREVKAIIFFLLLRYEFSLEFTI